MTTTARYQVEKKSIQEWSPGVSYKHPRQSGAAQRFGVVDTHTTMPNGFGSSEQVYLPVCNPCRTKKRAEAIAAFANETNFDGRGDLDGMWESDCYKKKEWDKAEWK